MSMLAFFPWLKIENDLEFKDIKLTPFKRVKKDDKTQDEFSNSCNKILHPYVGCGDKPLQEATLLFLKDKDPLVDYSEEERNYLFSAVELIAFAGLSKREYFNQIPFSYCNRSNFNFVIQSFRPESSRITIVTRRRDGTNTSSISLDDFKVRIPEQVNYNYIDIDLPLLISLFEAQEKLDAGWIDFYDAIFNFNHANEDDNQITLQQETIMMIGAFQRILGCNNAKEDELVNKFLEVFKPSNDFDCSTSNKVRGSKYQGQNKSLKEIWLRDFYQLRGDFAHGKRDSRKQLLWKAHEHLLLATYVFPLLVKLQLAKDGFYSPTDEDIFNIDVFEELADADLFKEPIDNYTWQWNIIRGNAKMKKCKLAFLKDLYTSKQGECDESTPN